MGLGSGAPRYKNSRTTKIGNRSANILIKPVKIGGDTAVSTCHFDADAHPFSIIHAGKIRIGITGSGSCAEPARDSRCEPAVILRRSAAALQVDNSIPASAEDFPHAPQLHQIDHWRTPVTQHLIKPGHASCQIEEGWRGQKRELSVRQAGTKPGKGIKPLHHVTKRAMFDHQNSFQSRVLCHTLSTAFLPFMPCDMKIGCCLALALA